MLFTLVFLRDILININSKPKGGVHQWPCSISTILMLYRNRDTCVTPDVRETLFLDGESVSLQACDGSVMRVIRCKAI